MNNTYVLPSYAISVRSFPKGGLADRLAVPETGITHKCFGSCMTIVHA